MIGTFLERHQAKVNHGSGGGGGGGGNTSHCGAKAAAVTTTIVGWGNVVSKSKNVVGKAIGNGMIMAAGPIGYATYNACVNGNSATGITGNPMGDPW